MTTPNSHYELGQLGVTFTRGLRSKEAPSAPFFTVGYTSPELGDFLFSIHSNRILVNNDNWQKLSENEQLNIFQSILAEYRLRSEGDNHWKGAAIGITQDNQLYIAMNTKRQDPFHKDCAEMNMVNSIETATGLSGNDTQPKLKSLYIMGGREPKTFSQTDIGSLINCPCGKCTDMLVENMENGGIIYALPIPREPSASLDPLEVISAQQPFSAIESLVGANRSVAWKTTIEHLNAHRYETLGRDEEGDDGALIQQAAQRDLPSKIIRLPELKAREQWGDKPFEKFMANLPKAGVHAIKEVAAAIKSVENILLHRDSIPALDIASSTPDEELRAVNKFMAQQLETTLATRVDKTRPDGTKIDAQKVAHGEALDARGRKIRSVRCVVIKLSDGTYHSGIDIDSDFDNASPSAAMNAIADAMPRLGNEGITHVWSMEFDPKDIAEERMETMPKEGLERIVKRSKNPQELALTFIPFNSGEIEDPAKLRKISRNIGLNEIFPSSFAGNRETPASTAQRQ